MSFYPYAFNTVDTDSSSQTSSSLLPWARRLASMPRRLQRALKQLAIRALKDTPRTCA